MQNFLSELQRRKVLRIASGYVVVSWISLQVALSLQAAMNLPDWFSTVIVSLLIIGFPVAVIISWFFEVSPEGIKRTPPSTTITSFKPQTMDVVLAAALVLVLAAVIVQLTASRDAASSQTAAGTDVPKPETTSAPDIPKASVAVLPFENLSEEKSNAFFAVGIQDEILTRLSKIGSLKVISRTSTAHMASRPDNLPEIARQLGVANILEGSVQRAGDTVRVNVQLIKADTDAHLWAEVYDRKLDNIFNVQTEIATAVAEALNAKVTGSEQQSLAQKPTNNVAAYDAYLRGLAFDHQNKGEQALASYKDAVRLDPDFALAWTAFAVGAAGGSFGSSNPKLGAEAVAALETARRLQPDLPELHLAQGAVEYYINEDYEAAQAQFNRGHAAQPNDVQSIFFLGLIARRQGRWDDSRSWLEKAIALDPMRADLRLSLHELLVATRDFTSAMRVIDDAMNRWPDGESVIAAKWDLLLRLGQLDQVDALIKTLGTRAEHDFEFQRVKFSVLRRNYSQAISVGLGWLDQKQGALQEAFMKGRLIQICALSGETRSAKDYFEQSKAFWLPQIAAEPRNRGALRALALDAGHMGERELALKYIEKAISLLPASKDHYSGPDLEEARATILALLGDRDRAIPEIARLLKTPYTGPLTPAQLRLDPDFDKLRGDPRFEALTRGDEPAK